MESSSINSCRLQGLNFSKFHISYIMNSIPEIDRAPGKVFRDYKPSSHRMQTGILPLSEACRFAEAGNLSYILSLYKNFIIQLYKSLTNDISYYNRI